jgi:hypothetical protein
MTKLWHNVTAACIVSLLSLALYSLPALAMPNSPPTQKLKLWTISKDRDETTLKACVATRDISTGVRVEVRLDPHAHVLQVTLYGVNFEHESGYGLWAIDGSKPTEVFVKRDNLWTSMLMLDARQAANDLSKFSKGRKLTLLLGQRKYAVDLAETGAMVAALKHCADNGQDELNEERMLAALPALTRV